MNKFIFFIGLIFCFTAEAANRGLSDQVLSPTFVVHFDYKSFVLNAEARRHLDSLTHMMQSKSFVIQQIEITGHCDSVASNEYNDILSLKRAHAVADYFKAHGIQENLINAIAGNGKRKPLNDNEDSLKRLANRRVEIVFQLMLPQAPDTVMITPPARVSAPLPDSAKKPMLDIGNLQVNDLLELKNINFYPNRHVILKESKKNLEVLLNTMQEYKTLRIEIRGHVCCLPDYQGDAFDEDSYKEDLSLERAKAIFNYLIEEGINGDRMTYIGLGGKFPKVKEFTEADKAANRRVEIKILSK